MEVERTNRWDVIENKIVVVEDRLTGLERDHAVLAEATGWVACALIFITVYLFTSAAFRRR